MRPINLIPEEERRRGSGVVTRTGPVAYLLVGVLGVVLIGVVLLVLFNNSIHDREGEVARLETEKAAATVQAAKLAPYINFKQVSEDRTRTVAELADSRFDWVRVIHQLSLVLPGDVYFNSFAASGGGGEGDIAGPSLMITGCASGQPAVAGFVASLRDVGGVTRVELNHSTLNDEAAETGGGDGSPCSKLGVAQFEVLVAFDAAPPSPDSSGSTVGEAAETEESEPAEEGSEEESSEGESSETESSEPEGAEGTSSSQSASATSAGATG